MTVHTALVAMQSPTLEKLVSGSMEEAQTRTVVWEDVEEDTFGLFAQFVYTADYTPPAFLAVVSRRIVSPRSSTVSLANSIDEALTASNTVVENEVSIKDPGEDGWSGFSSRKDKKKKRIVQYELFEAPPPEPAVVLQDDEWENGVAYIGKSKKNGGKVVCSDTQCKGQSFGIPYFAISQVSSHSRFHELVFPLPSVNFGYAGICTPRGNESADEDFTPVFLGHARLYVFADKYNIESLKSLVLNKLHNTLCKFSLYEARYGDVVELVRYTYENTPSRTPRDSLRELVTHYVAYEAIKVAGSEQGLSLVEENGSFARDLLLMVLERIA